MKSENKKLQSELCNYYKGEKENPFMNEINTNRRHFWEYEKTFFDNPNVFQMDDIFDRFSDHVTKALDGYIAENKGSLRKAIQEYFDYIPKSEN